MHGSQPLRKETLWHDAQLERTDRRVVEGDWTDPETGKPAKVPFETIRSPRRSMAARPMSSAPLELGKRLAVVSDVNTHEAMGRRVAKELKGARHDR